jgi:RNase P subunit RPR2
MEQVEPEKWYLVAHCRNCGEPMRFGKAVQAPPATAPVPTKLELTCPQCGMTATYDPSQILRTRAKSKQ